MNSVFVLSSTRKPLMPTRPARARRLLRDGKAAVYRLQPFTIILKDRADGDTQPIEAKFDPGSKTTGIAVVGEFPRQGRVVLLGLHLTHRGDRIRKRLSDRCAIRRGRRGRKTRYREARFNNRRRPAGWLAPSLQSRVDNVRHWLNKLVQRLPITTVAVETVRFDTQALQHPEISGVEYQQGTLAGYEVREYLLEKWNRTCAYCGVQHVPLDIEHIDPRSKGGSHRVSNLTLACRSCNQKKGHQPLATFLAHDPTRLKRIKAQAKTPLKDVTAVNATRYAIGNALKPLELPLSFWSGGRTKHNRTRQHYPKAHWIDAACVGDTGAAVHLSAHHTPLTVTATGRGQRQVVRSDQYGFQTGDWVTLTQPKGQYAGHHRGRLAGIRTDGRLDIATTVGKITAPWHRFVLIQRGDGYVYT